MLKRVTDINLDDYEIDNNISRTLLISAVQSEIKRISPMQAIDPDNFAFLVANEIIELLIEYDYITFTSKQLDQIKQNIYKQAMKKASLLEIQVSEHVDELTAYKINHEIEHHISKNNLGVDPINLSERIFLMGTPAYRKIVDDATLKKGTKQ